MRALSTGAELQNGTLTLAGYRIRLRVSKGHLEAEDGAGRHRRTLRFPRVSPQLERVVVLGHSGSVSLDALQWLQDTGVAFVQIGSDSQLISATAPSVRRHSELIRAQALAQVNGAALALSRDLIRGKIAGQRTVLAQIQSTDNARSLLEALEGDCESAQSGSDLLTIEAKAANEYWSAWAGVPVAYVSRDKGLVPESWRSFGGRGSPLSNNGQHAVNPANAILNYLYSILRAETRLAIATLGMEPGLSVFHSTRRWRDSFSYDLMEPIRPIVDAYLLELLEDRKFSRRLFFETRRGVVRIMPPLAGELSGTAPLWREAVGPLVERVSRELMVWADAGERGALTRRDGNTSDGSILPTNLTSEYRRGGRPKTQLKRRQSMRKAWQANQDWAAANPDFEIDIDYEKEILSGLQHVRLREIQEATGLSLSYSAAIRNGREVPHRRHWNPLITLIANNGTRISAERTLADQWDGIEFQRDLQPGLRHLSIIRIANALKISRPYAAQIRRGEKVPAMKHWERIAKLSGHVR